MIEHKSLKVLTMFFEKVNLMNAFRIKTFEYYEIMRKIKKRFLERVQTMDAKEDVLGL
jgi:hypothetical protein